MNNKNIIRFIFQSARSLAIAITVVFLVACDSNEKTAIITIPMVNVMTVDISPSYSVTREFVGTVYASQRANLGFEFGGKIEAIFVDIGDSVQQGEPMIKLDTQLLNTEAQLLNAQLEQLDAQIELVNNNLRRQRKLKDKGFSADAEIDSLTSQRDALLANIRQGNASLAANQLRKDKSTIYAPYTGKINQRFISIGDVVNLGDPTLTLLNLPKEARIGVPVKYLSEIIESTQLTLRVGDALFNTQILNPSPSIDTRARTVMLRLSLPENADVLNGELAYLKYDLQISETGFWMPLTGLTDGLRGTWNVYAVIEENGKHLVTRRSVQILYTDDKNAFVSGAIKNTDNVVTEGIHRIVSGQQVNILAE